MGCWGGSWEAGALRASLHAVLGPGPPPDLMKGGSIVRAVGLAFTLLVCVLWPGFWSRIAGCDHCSSGGRNRDCSGFPIARPSLRHDNSAVGALVPWRHPAATPRHSVEGTLDFGASEQRQLQQVYLLNATGSPDGLAPQLKCSFRSGPPALHCSRLRLKRAQAGHHAAPPPTNCPHATRHPHHALPPTPSSAPTSPPAPPPPPPPSVLPAATAPGASVAPAPPALGPLAAKSLASCPAGRASSATS